MKISVEKNKFKKNRGRMGEERYKKKMDEKENKKKRGS
jgi:hypothetical protein